MSEVEGGLLSSMMAERRRKVEILRLECEGEGRNVEPGRT